MQNILLFISIIVILISLFILTFNFNKTLIRKEGYNLDKNKYFLIGKNWVKILENDITLEKFINNNLPNTPFTIEDKRNVEKDINDLNITITDYFKWKPLKINKVYKPINFLGITMALTIFLTLKYNACFYKKDLLSINKIGFNLRKLEEIIYYNIDTKILKFSNELGKKIKELYNTENCRFIILNLYLNWKSYSGSHAGLILIDKYNKTIERFEPHGSVHVTDDSKYSLDLKILQMLKYLNILDDEFKYYTPLNICPYQGIQNSLDIQKDQEKIDYSLKGYCFFFCLLYLEFRMKYPDVNQLILQKHIINSIKELKHTNIGIFIHYYANYILNIATSLKSVTPI